MTPSSFMEKFLLKDGNVRAVLISASTLIEEIVGRHQLTGEPAQALGEAALAGLQVAAYCKSGEKVNLSIQGSGKLRQVFVDADPNGFARGYVLVDLESEIPGWGNGILSVLRTKGTQKGQPYTGAVSLAQEPLEVELDRYWNQSEQIPTTTVIQVAFEGTRATIARSLLLQAMPGATPAEVAIVLGARPEMSALLNSPEFEANPETALRSIFQGRTFEALEKRELAFRCTCSRERAENTIMLIGEKEIEAMMNAGDGAEIRCDFCNAEYTFGEPELRKLLQRARTH